MSRVLWSEVVYSSVNFHFRTLKVILLVNPLYLGSPDTGREEEEREVGRGTQGRGTEISVATTLLYHSLWCKVRGRGGSYLATTFRVEGPIQEVEPVVSHVIAFPGISCKAPRKQ